MLISIQFFGGRGAGGGGSARGKSGGGGAAAKAGGQITHEKTFAAKDLKAGTGRTGEPNRYNDTVESYANQIAQDVKPGDQIIVEKSMKDGSTRSTTLTAKETTKEWMGGTTTKGLGVSVSGNTRGIEDPSFRFLGESGTRSGSDLAAFISHGRSQVKSVRVRVRKR